MTINPYLNLYHKLDFFQTRLSQSMKDIWRFKLSLNRAIEEEDYHEEDFFPRRLKSQLFKAQTHYEVLVEELDLILQSSLINRPLIPIEDSIDLEIYKKIRIKVRYLQNAYASDLPSAKKTLSHLNRLLAKK